MVLTELLAEAFSAITVNKTRSGLTVLGIVIGIGSVIAMISIGQGAQGSINASIQSLGSNLLLVTPGAQRTVGNFGVSAGRGTAQSLTQADADAIASQVQNVFTVASEVSSRQQVIAKGANTNTTIDGVTASYPSIRNIQIAEGSFFSDIQNQSLAKVAVLGPTVVTDLFPDGSDPIGQVIRIKNLEFTIIGTTVAKGGTGFASSDNIIYVPALSAEHFFTGNEYLTTVDIQAVSANVMTQVQNDATALLLARHNISDPTKADFQVLNQNDVLAAASTITNTFTILLASIAGISLLVGGIGIMNMMLTTVTERTREIGLRKAIGAKNRDISIQFLMEAVMLTFLGGVVGVLLGWGLSFLIKLLANITTSVTLWPVLLAFGVSALIGIIFGYYPARRAAGLNPIEALRYE